MIHSISNWIYTVFSSKASLSEITVVGIFAAFLTYFSDRNKRNEFRNANLFELRKKAAKEINKNIKIEVEALTLRMVTVLEEYQEFKKGSFYEGTRRKSPTENEMREKFHVEGSSKPMSYFLGALQAVIYSEYGLIDSLHEMFDPGVKEVSLWTGFTVSTGPEMVEKLVEGLTDIHKNMGEQIKLIHTQFQKKLSGLQPKEPLRRRVETRVVLLKNRRTVKKMLKKINQ